MDKVSIIIPVYNVELYLVECLESVVNQTYKNLEIILINDGSKDNSPNICAEYAKKDSRIIFVNQENVGVSATRNKGIDIASGKYICFVDADDFCELDMVELAVNSVEEGKLFMYGYNEVYKNKVIPIKYDFDINLENLHEIVLKASIGQLWNKIFITQILKKEKIYFNSEVHNCEDLLFVLDYIQHVKQIEYKTYILYNHRVGKNSVMFFKEPNLRNITILNSYDKILKLPKINEMVKEKIEYEYIVTYFRIKNFLPKNFGVRQDLIQSASKILTSSKYTFKEKIRYIVIRYFNKIYTKYYLRKMDETMMF